MDRGFIVFKLINLTFFQTSFLIFFNNLTKSAKTIKTVAQIIILSITSELVFLVLGFLWREELRSDSRRGRPSGEAVDVFFQNFFKHICLGVGRWLSVGLACF